MGGDCGNDVVAVNEMVEVYAQYVWVYLVEWMVEGNNGKGVRI